MEGSCEHGNEHSGSIKYWEILEKLSDWWLLKKDSATWSYFLTYKLILSPLKIKITPTDNILQREY
jgi:hypothetical protein